MSIRGNTIGFPLPDPRKGMDMEGNGISNLANPLNPGDAVPKAYLDEVIAQVMEHINDAVGGVAPHVGFIYASNVATSPAEIYGGTWEKIKDRFLLAAGDTYAAGSTGGEATHTLTVEEMPSHNHSFARDPGSGDRHDSGYTASGSYTYDSNSETNYTGGSKPHNNMPPYLAVYMWKRVA